MVPRSEMRVSVVRSGFWKTVMRMESPSPRVSRDWAKAAAGSVIAATHSTSELICKRMEREYSRTTFMDDFVA